MTTAHLTVVANAGTPAQLALRTIPADLDGAQLLAARAAAQAKRQGRTGVRILTVERAA